MGSETIAACRFTGRSIAKRRRDSLLHPCGPVPLVMKW
jgi:hypothetical protein